MSVGWKRQYETAAVCEFYQVVQMFANEKPNDAKLQAFAHRCKLTVIMLSTQERNDLETGSIVNDRLSDCENCRRWNDGTMPCETEEGRKCIYSQPKHKAEVIERYFGDEGRHFIEWAGKIIKKREAKACTR